MSLLMVKRKDGTVTAAIGCVFFCPECGRAHVDRGIWRHRAHHTHRCEFCLYEWDDFGFYCIGEKPTELADKLMDLRACASSFVRRGLRRLASRLFNVS